MSGTSNGCENLCDGHFVQYWDGGAIAGEMCSAPHCGRTMTHEERLRLINAPLPIPCIQGSRSHANTHGFRAPDLSQLEEDQGVW